MIQSITRRSILFGGSAALLHGMTPRASAADWRDARAGRNVLRISHQWPGALNGSGDFRDGVIRKFAREVEQRTSNSLKFEIFPDESFVAASAQFGSLQRGDLDLAVFPLSYAAASIPALNIALLPALVQGYDQARAWKQSRLGDEIRRLTEANGIKIVSWLWQPGGIASRTKPLVTPGDVEGRTIRSGGEEFEQFLSRLGGSTRDLSSSQFYQSMQSGAIDAVITSSTSLIDLHLEELSRSLTGISDRSIWFVLEPLVMSVDRFGGLTRSQKSILLAAGEETEELWIREAKADDRRLANLFGRQRVQIKYMDDSAFQEWRAAAIEHSWPYYSRRSDECANLLKLAQDIG